MAHVEQLLERARQALREGAYRTAQGLFAQCVSVHPRSDEAYFGLALASALLDDFETAVDHFRACADINPRRASAHINEGIALMMLGRYDEAIQALRRGLQLSPGSALAYYNLGLAYRKKGVLDLAGEAFREAIRKDPQLIQAYLNLGNVLFDLGRFREAAVAYNDGLKRAAENESLRAGYRAATKMAELKETAEAATKPPWVKKTAASGAQPGAQVAGEQPAVPFSSVVERGDALARVGELAANQRKGIEQMIRILEGDIRSSTGDLIHALVHSTAGASQVVAILPAYREAMEKLMGCAASVREGTRQLSFLASRFEANARHTR